MVINNYVLENIVKFYEYLCFLVVIDVWLLFLLSAACLAEKQQIPKVEKMIRKLILFWLFYTVHSSKYKNHLFQYYTILQLC
jgi:hypothetical protein